MSESEFAVQWEGDVLGRKPLADFLYRFLVKKYQVSVSASDRGAMCFALDGRWGSGKSFFVNRWVTDIKNCQHPVVYFDAWKNDLSEEPLLGFVSSVKQGMKPWAKKLPAARRAGMRSREREFVKNAGRAIVSGSVVIAKGVIKKSLGVAVDEVAAAVTSKDGSSESHSIGQWDGSSKIMSEAIDALFNASVGEHCKRMAAVGELKVSLGGLLEYLHSHAGANLPMFVFVDELDRCRPSYAIELLEGIKHLFDAPGVCFCVSTNIEQLSHSIRGAYGSGFDSYSYLKRFFSFEYVLPDPSIDDFGAMLTRDSLLSKVSVVTGLPDSSSSQESQLSRVFSLVSRCFKLTLRDQQQVFAIADAAAAGSLEAKFPIHLLFLFCLAGIKHKAPAKLAEIASGRRLKQSIEAELAGIIDAEVACKYKIRVDAGAFRDDYKNHITKLTDVLDLYLKLARQDLKEIYEQVNTVEHQAYPESLKRVLAQELGNSFSRGREYSPSIRQYASLIERAGQLFTRADG